MPETGSPTVRRRELGALLRTLRTARGLTVEQVAESLGCSTSKVSRMETGYGVATPPEIRELCRLYGVTDEAERDRMLSLARQGKRRGWWQGFELESFATYVGLEAAAESVIYYQSSIVPGLLQTREYARAMYEAGTPRFPAERIEEFIEVRMTRQQLLAQPSPLRLEVILDEAVLRREVGGRDVMRAQLRRLAEVSAWPNVTIQIVPFAAGAHPAMDSTFRILGFAEPGAASLVYVEGLVGWLYLERPQDLERYQQVFEHLRTVALSPQDSSRLLTEIGAGRDLPPVFAAPGTEG